MNITIRCNRFKIIFQERRSRMNKMAEITIAIRFGVLNSNLTFSSFQLNSYFLYDLIIFL
jgi:hypothetical protein